MRSPEQIVDATKRHTSKRSAEYWRGVLDVLRFRMGGVRIQCPYREGTAQFDAYFAGNVRGHYVWWDMAEEAEPQ